jgi:hypothetical protein
MIIYYMITDTEMMMLLAVALIGIFFVSKKGGSPDMMMNVMKEHKVVIGVVGLVILVYFLYTSSAKKEYYSGMKAEYYSDEEPTLEFVATEPSKEEQQEPAPPAGEDATKVEGNFLHAPNHTKMFEQLATSPTYSYMLNASQNDPTRSIDLCPLTRKFLTKDLRQQIPVPVQDAEKFPFLMSSQATQVKDSDDICLNRGIDAKCY